MVKKNRNKINVSLSRSPLSLSKGEHENHITAHIHNSNFVTGYILLCSRLYILNIIKFGSNDNDFLESSLFPTTEIFSIIQYTFRRKQEQKNDFYFMEHRFN